MLRPTESRLWFSALLPLGAWEPEERLVPGPPQSSRVKGSSLARGPGYINSPPGVPVPRQSRCVEASPLQL